MPTSNPMRSASNVPEQRTLHGRTGTTKRTVTTAKVDEREKFIVLDGRVYKAIQGVTPITRELSRRLAKIMGQVSPTQPDQRKKAQAAYEKALTAASRELCKELVGLKPELARVILISISGGIPEFDQFSNPPIKIREDRVNVPRSVALRPVNNTTVIGRARQAGEVFKAKVLAQPDMLSAEDAAGRVGKSRQTINDQRLAGKIIGLSFGSNRFRYPEWQFHDSIYGKPLEAVLEVLGNADPWEKWRFFVTEDGMLAGKAPAEVMQSTELPLERVIRAAKVFSER